MDATQLQQLATHSMAIGHIVSRPVAEYVAKHQDPTESDLYDYQGEDISLGIWVAESPLNATMQWISSKHLTNKGDCAHPSFWMAGECVVTLFCRGLHDKLLRHAAFI